MARAQIIYRSACRDEHVEWMMWPIHVSSSCLQNKKTETAVSCYFALSIQYEPKSLRALSHLNDLASACRRIKISVNRWLR